MGHGRLIDNDYSSTWPEFLLNLKKSAEGTHSNAEVHPPEIIEMNNSKDEKLLRELVKTKSISRFIDNYDEQLAELFISRDAHLYRANEDVQRHSIANLIKQHYGQKKSWQLGSWVYFAWSQTLVHVLESDLFFELRTIRNRGLIDKKEQESLRQFKIGSIGMSVGSSGALAMVLSGISQDIKLADGAVISGSNLNRILTGVSNVGDEKSSVIARQMYEMNPYLNIYVLPNKLSAINVNDFIDKPWPIDLIIDEIDDLEMKIRIRVEARKRHIPVIMATELADTVMLDIERFDLEPNRPLFHGLIKDIESLLDNKPANQREWMKHATSIIGTKNVPLRMQQSLLKIGTKIVTHPQLGSTAMVVGGILAFAAKNIALGNNLPSQRKSISLEKVFLPKHRTYKHKIQQSRHTRILKRSIGSM